MDRRSGDDGQTVAEAMRQKHVKDEPLFLIVKIPLTGSAFESILPRSSLAGSITALAKEWALHTNKTPTMIKEENKEIVGLIDVSRAERSCGGISLSSLLQTTSSDLFK